MKKVDVEYDVKMARRAKLYLEKLCCGINPIDGTCVVDDSVVREEKVIACFKYVIGVLDTFEEAIEYMPQKKLRNKDKVAFALSDEDITRIPVKSDNLSLSSVVRNINSIIDDGVMRKLKLNSVSSWLVDKGFLKVLHDRSGKSFRRPTDEGKVLGIYTCELISKDNRPYTAVLYNRQAQQFIADNIGEIIEYSKTLK